MTQPRIVCVLGMHRAGTSLVTQVLDLLGVYLGPESQLFPPTPENPRGYWEHIPFYRVNEGILKRLGGTWDEPPGFPPGWFTAAELADLRTQARRAITEGFAGHALWGWKDPRTCLTLPFWQALLPPMHYVVCLRSMTDVARSLERRDGFSSEKSARLWLLHVASAFAHTAGRPRLPLFYEDLMAGWQEQARRLASFLGVPERADDPAVQRAVGAAVDQELHHHRTSLPDAADDPALPFPAKAASLVLRAGIRPAAGGADQDPGLQAALDVFVRVAVAADEHERCLVESRNNLETELGVVRARLTEREAELGAIRGRLAGLEAEMATLTSGMAWGIISAYRRGVETALPPGSRRRRTYGATMRGVRAVFRGLWSLVLTRSLRAASRSEDLERDR